MSEEKQEGRIISSMPHENVDAFNADPLATIDHFDETFKHIAMVRRYLFKIARIFIQSQNFTDDVIKTLIALGHGGLFNRVVIFNSLLERAACHDQSKLMPIEYKSFMKATKLRDLEYDSPEYKLELETTLKGALEHHYKVNDHHPEHFENGISDMEIPQILEMICDWLAATHRHEHGDIFVSIDQNMSRFGYSENHRAVFIEIANYLLDP